ncbi:sigma-70 family RNA polymerase sigma factor [Bacteroidota bacterium]
MPLNESPDLALWVDEYTSDLYSWALYKVSDEELAKDLVQDTFLAAAEKLDSFRGDSSPKTYLFSIINYKIIDHYRKKVNRPVTMENDKLSAFFSENGDWHEQKKPHEWHEDDTNLLDNMDFQSVLQDCITNLPDKWNACVTSKYLVEKKTEEICQELGITTTNYWQMMHRAKLQLRECIEENWFQE